MQFSSRFTAVLVLLSGFATQVLSSPLETNSKRNQPLRSKALMDNRIVPSTLAPAAFPTSTGSNSPKAPPVSAHAVVRRFVRSYNISTTTVSEGETITVVPVIVVVGGPGGGAYVIGGGAPVPVAAGQTATAENGDTQPTPTPSQSSSSSSSSSSSTSTTTTTSTTSSTSSPSPSGVQVPYIIIPAQGLNAEDLPAFTTFLEDSIKAVGVTNLTDTNLGLLFWAANLTASQATEVSQNPTAGAVTLDEVPIDSGIESTSSEATTKRHNQRSFQRRGPYQKNGNNGLLWERDGTIIKQTNATTENRVFSQPKDVPITSVNDYSYDSQAGVGTTIYIIDSGVNPWHPDFVDMPGTKRWIFTPGADTEEDDSDPEGRGSCLVSKAAGVTYGTAKRSDVVVVKYANHKVGAVFVSRIMTGLKLIKDDIIANKLTGKAVVTMPFAIEVKVPQLVSTFEAYLKHLIDIDVVLVAASGNYRDASDDIDGYPALFGPSMPIIVVGAVDNSGNRAHFSQGTDKLTVSAPGVDIVCASQFEDADQEVNGTSSAAASVAGLAAYFLSLNDLSSQLQVPGQVAKNVLERVTAFAWPRTANGPSVAWNNQNGGLVGCGTSTNKKRQGTACSSSSTSSTPSATSSTSSTTSSTTSATASPTPVSGFGSTQRCPTVPVNEGSDYPGFDCPGGRLETSNQLSFYTTFSTCSDDVVVEFTFDDGVVENVDVSAGYQGSSHVFGPCTWIARIK